MSDKYFKMPTEEEIAEQYQRMEEALKRFESMFTHCLPLDRIPAAKPTAPLHAEHGEKEEA